MSAGPLNRSGPVVIDLSPAQSPDYAERGIARHTVEFAKAVVARHPDLVGHLLIDPRRAPLAGIEDWAERGAIPGDRWVPRPGEILHLISPFELEQPLERLWPRAASAVGARLVVTVHDLIPEVMAVDYLADPGLRRRWRARRSLVRAAQRVLTLSHSASTDVIDRLDIPAERVTLIGAGCGPEFRAAGDRAEARRAVRRGVPGLAERFVVYNGGTDPRKNLDRLLVAWGQLTRPLRDRWQLVIVCRMDPGTRHHYQSRAEELGIAASVFLAGFLTDATLVRLYQSTDLVVFPSLYEGYGLPVVEALACGAAVVAAGNSCLVELVAPEATFDASDPGAIAVAITRGLTDDPYRARLLAAATKPPPSWNTAADRAAAVYRQLADDTPRRAPVDDTPHHRPLRRRATLGMVMSTAASPWAGADGQLARALGAHRFEIDHFGAGDGQGEGDGDSDGVGQDGAPRSTLGAAAAIRAGYDAVVVTLADHPAYRGVLSWLLDVARPTGAPTIVVVARELSLVGLYRAGPPDYFAREWRAHYPAAPLSPTDGDQGLMVRGAVAAADFYLVDSATAAATLSVELPPELVGRVVVAGGDAADVAVCVQLLLGGVMSRATG